MRIWIDLANAPHVAFFRPIIGELERRGHSVLISLRDFNQTVELARRIGLGGAVIGTHGGRTSTGKALNLLGRAGWLARFAREARADIAVSHNSYTQAIAARVVRARVVTLMDFEGQPANHIAFRLAHRVIVPAAFPAAALRRFGCSPGQVRRYDGFKEQVYLSDFTPDPGFVETLRRACRLGPEWDPSGTVVVTVRTPPSFATYHRFPNRLFEKLLERLECTGDTTVVLLPRSEEQRRAYAARFPRLRIPTEALSGTDLVALSDVVVSAGGTMNREAAILGTPVWTIFAGELPAVDRCLIGMGRMRALQAVCDIESLPLRKKNGCTMLANTGLRDTLVSWITGG